VTESSSNRPPRLLPAPARKLVTPIYVKPRDDTRLPREGVFYLLTADGLFICRNHEFFRSSVRARTPPAEIGRHREFLEVSYPIVPRHILERCVGFFASIADLYDAEAAAVLAWDRAAQRMEIVVPDQVSIVERTWNGWTYPLNVEYELPILPGNLVALGDIHSHVNGHAYASYTDELDESYRPGLHIVVGRIDKEPPDFHIEAVVDGVRFTVEQSLVLEGYRERARDVPPAWIGKVTVKERSSARGTYASGGRGGGV
jgi:hypothetical protein